MAVLVNITVGVLNGVVVPISFWDSKDCARQKGCICGGRLDKHLVTWREG